MLTKLKDLYLSGTQITDAGCATLAAALDSGALPALNDLCLESIPASAAAKAAVYETRDELKDWELESDYEEDESEEDEEETDEEGGEGDDEGS